MLFHVIWFVKQTFWKQLAERLVIITRHALVWKAVLVAVLSLSGCIYVGDADAVTCQLKLNVSSTRAFCKCKSRAVAPPRECTPRMAGLSCWRTCCICLQSYKTFKCPMKPRSNPKYDILIYDYVNDVIVTPNSLRIREDGTTITNRSWCRVHCCQRR